MGESIQVLEALNKWGVDLNSAWTTGIASRLDWHGNQIRKWAADYTYRLICYFHAMLVAPSMWLAQITYLLQRNLYYHHYTNTSKNSAVCPGIYQYKFSCSMAQSELRCNSKRFRRECYALAFIRRLVFSAVCFVIPREKKGDRLNDPSLWSHKKGRRRLNQPPPPLVLFPGEPITCNGDD
jgi:hypothetical protein